MIDEVMQTTFKIGDKAVYPGQGVGEVMGIEHKDIAGQRQSFTYSRSGKRDENPHPHQQGRVGCAAQPDR